MSRVFVAEETSLGRQVVIKVLLPELAAGVSVVRFRREIGLAARLQHLNIVPVLGTGDTEGLPYFTMPYVRGESVRALLDRGEKVPIRAAVRILRDVAAALAYAHAEGVVHRDIKPANILLSSGGGAMVTDFGVARALSSARDGHDHHATGGMLTTAGTSLGTPAYMAPEQAAGDPSVDHRADIYSFGITAYHLLSGHLPFECNSPTATLAAHFSQTPAPIARERPDIPPPLATLVTRCLEKSPADRPQSADEIVRELDDLSGVREVSSRIPFLSNRRWMRRGMIIATTLLLAVIVVGTVVILRGRSAVAARAAHVGLAVLPFENQGKPEDAYFVDGLTEAIGNRLARLAGLSVVDRRSTVAFNQASESPKQIGEKLNVDYVLAGTVQWAGVNGGRRAQITPVVIRVSDGTTAWAPEPYLVTATDVFRVQTEIATRVAEALNVALMEHDRQVLAEKPTENAGAYDFYLRGLDFFRRAQGEHLDPAMLQRSIDAYEHAVAADPQFVLAFAKLAEARYWWASLEPSDDSRAKLFNAALDRAERLDPQLPEVRAVESLRMDH